MFRNGSLSQDPIDVLVGLTRGTARVAQKDICMEEMMVAVGLNRARIRLGKWVHLKFQLSLARASSRAGASRQNQSATISLTRTNFAPFSIAAR
jgi:hypothetical protein